MTIAVDLGRKATKQTKPVESKNENKSIPGKYFERVIAKSWETCILRELPVGACLFRFLVGVGVKNHVTDDVTVVSSV